MLTEDGGQVVESRSDGGVTIAIPTFNRADAVEDALGDVLPLAEAGAVSVLVVDDGSGDDTFERLQSYVGPGVRVLRNERNLGYARTLCRILREADTEWVLVSADDDRLDLDGLPALLSWLRSTRPDLVSTQWRREEGELYRGRASNGPIKAEDLLAAASHAPGLIYRTPAAVRALPLLESHLDRESDAALTYPQLVLAAQLVAGGGAMWWAGTVVRQGAALPSGINDASGRHYSDPASRLSQGLAFDLIYRDMKAAAPTREYRRCAEQWERWNGRNLYPSVRAALLMANDQADPRLLDASVRGYVLRSGWRTMAGWIRAPRRS